MQFHNASDNSLSGFNALKKCNLIQRGFLFVKWNHISLFCMFCPPFAAETVFNIVIFLLSALSLNKTTVCENAYCKIEVTEHHRIQELGMPI